MNNISQEKVRLKTEIKSLKQGKNSNNIFRTTMEHGRWAITANKTEEAKKTEEYTSIWIPVQFQYAKTTQSNIQ